MRIEAPASGLTALGRSARNQGGKPMTKPPRRLNLLDRPKAAQGTADQRQDDGDGWDGLISRQSSGRAN
jgi:hypothetical protein